MTSISESELSDLHDLVVRLEALVGRWVPVQQELPFHPAPAMGLHSLADRLRHLASALYGLR